MFHRLGQFCFDRRWAVIAAWVAAALALRLMAPRWEQVAFDGDLDQLPADTTTYRAARLNAEAFPDDRARSQLVLVFARSDAPLSGEDRRFAIATARELESLPDMPLVDRAWTETTPVIGPMLKSADGRATRVVVRLTNDLMAVDNVRVLADVQRLIGRRQNEAPPGLKIGVTGSAAIGGDILTAAGESLRNTDRTTILLVVAALALIYRSPWLVVIPLAAIGAAAVASLELLALLAGITVDHPALWPDVRVFTTTRIFVVVLLFGVGTDFCLFLIARFRELRAAGVDHREAVAQALGRVSTAISASAFTTIVGLAMMGFADFGKFAYSGPAIGVSLAIALAVCITLAPALLSTRLGARVGQQPGAGTPRMVSRDAEFAERNAEQETESQPTIWTALADRVLRTPGLVLAASAIVALPLAWYGAAAPVTYDLFSELAPTSITRRGADLLLQHFPAGEVAPMVVLARLPDGALNDDDGRDKIAELTKRLHDLDGVHTVRSFYRPTGEAPGAISVFSASGLAELTAANSPLARSTFVAHLGPGRGDVTRLFVTLNEPPFSTSAVVSVARLERSLSELSGDPESPWRGATFELLGPTSGIRDLERVTLADRRRIEWLVSAAVFAVILVMLRRPLVCAFLIVSVIAGYFVTLGIVRFIFVTAYGVEYPGLDWKAPIFLFVILVAVGQDYNIYLVTRVIEEQRRLGPSEGLRRAVVQTGGIITSCGVIMAATFGSMITGSLRGMVELGVALSLGILLDTFVVRTIIVPAFLALLAKSKERRAVGSRSASGG
jgi:RND superfamily putative drug exporter